jgi:FtsZ-interacting cell division protein ZipA
MTELQIGLLAIGALVVLGVLAYNRMQERGARKDTERAFRSAHADALLGDEARRKEPTAEGARPAVRSEAPAAISPPDPRLDYVVELGLSGALPYAVVQESWQAIDRRHGRPVQLAAAADGGAWHPLTAHEAVPPTRLRAGLQLVSREGAVGEAELIEFRSAVETLAASLHATVSAPEMRSAIEAAQELDRFCSEADIQVVLHVVAAPGGALAGSKLRAIAESSGLALEGSGRFAQRTDGGALQFTQAVRDGTRFEPGTLRSASFAAVSLELDLPRTPDAHRSFEAMARLATHLAAQLGGRVEDDNGNALDERALAAIASQLDAVRARLEARGLTPGSAAALRVFG